MCICNIFWLPIYTDWVSDTCFQERERSGESGRESTPRLQGRGLAKVFHKLVEEQIDSTTGSVDLRKINTTHQNDFHMARAEKVATKSCHMLK